METEIKRGPGRPPKTVTTQPTTDKAPSIEDLSKEELLNLYRNKEEQFTKIVQAYQEREQKLQQTLQQVTLEYNSRTQYFLDCVKHAYVSMQFAVNSVKTTEKE